MIAKARNWFFALSSREQWLVGIAGLLTAWVVLIFGMILPALAAIDSAKLEHDEAVERRGRIEAVVQGASLPQPTMSRSGDVNLDIIVTQSAAEQGFDLIKSTGSAPGQMSFRIDQARAPALLAWLSGLEAQGVEIRSISISGGASGSLKVDARLQQVAR